MMRLSINSTFKNKADISQQRAIAKSFENFEVSQTELAIIINGGYAFCSQHDGARKSVNYIPSNVLAVDIDTGLTIEEAMRHGFVTSYCAIVYTTVNHSEDFNRFRLVFETDRLITNQEEMKNALNGLIHKFGGDASCKDACRMFYGSEGSNPTIIGNKIPNQILDELIHFGKETFNKSARSDTNGGAVSATISNRILNKSELLMLSDGEETTIDFIPERTKVYCPFHVDNNPSAFVVESKEGVRGVHCSTCKQTFFSSSKVPPHDFDYDLEKVKWNDIKCTFDSGHVIQIKEKFLADINLENECVLVKSPKGSGKTEWLKKVITKAKKKRLSILLIGHRRSLIVSLSKRLGLTSYYNPPSGVEMVGFERSTWVKPTKMYAISLDSMRKMLKGQRRKYDVVIIDEVEQVFSHMTSSTMGQKNLRINTYQYLQNYIRSASQVYVLDADLNSLTVNALCRFDKDKKFDMVVNRYKVENKQLNVYESKPHLKGELSRSFKLGERNFVCSNARGNINDLHAYFSNEYPSLNFLKITSETSNEPEVQDFINDITVKILEYDGVFASPTIATGIDITFERGESKIDNVFGFFEAKINTHFDIDQQLSRVRNPKAMKVWVSPQEFRFETNTEVIKLEVEMSNNSNNHEKVVNFNDEGVEELESIDSGYLGLFADVVSFQRCSKNHLKHNFIEYKKSEGFLVNIIEKDDEIADEGKHISQKSKEYSNEEKVNLLTSAYLLTSFDYEELSKCKESLALTEQQMNAMRRYELEAFYRAEITEGLVLQDDNGKKRNCTKQYEYFLEDDTDSIRRDESDISHNVHQTDRGNFMVKKELIRNIFRLSGLLDNNERIISGGEIHRIQLSEMVDYVKKNDVKIQRILGFHVRGDIVNKPVQQLGVFLKLFGLSWCKRSKRNAGGGKDYYYWVSDDQLNELNELVRIRDDNDHLNKWRHTREDETTHRLFSGRYLSGKHEVKSQIKNGGTIEADTFERNYDYDGSSSNGW